MNRVVKLILPLLFHDSLNVAHKDTRLLETVLHLLLCFLYLVPVTAVTEIGRADVTQRK
jgi:hypothetical protein